jgi:hypothetical protein
MTDYRIKELGSSFVIAADGQDVIRCADESIARQIVRDAETAAPSLGLASARLLPMTAEPDAEMRCLRSHQSV